MKKKGLKSRRGQITIFVILAIILVGAVALFFMLKGKVAPVTGGDKEINPNAFMSSCMEEEISEAVKKISNSGGKLNNPLNKTFKFGDGEIYSISYLCYNSEYYYPCVNQEPLLTKYLEEEIKEYLSPYAEDCFNEMLSSLEKKDYTVEVREGDFSIKLVPKKVVAELNASLTLTKEDESSKYENFKITESSEIYGIADVVREIINKETGSCEFDEGGFMIFYPKYKINVFTATDATKIYVVENKNSEEKFRFAVRGCVIPAGY